jgi:glycosyltransferase involved in cell wall biosynthesis
VIVVNDGSSDDTQEVIDRFTHPKLQKISQKNAGKAKAIFAGVALATGTHIVMIDSDLLGLATHHITALIAPV